MEGGSADEIDLWQLLLQGIRFFKKRKAVILPFFFSGILFGWIHPLLFPAEYKAYYRKEYIAGSSVTTNEILCDILNASVSSLREVPGFRSLKAKLEANSNKETRLKVTIETLNPAADSVAEFLVAYCNSIGSLREKFGLQQRQNQELLGLLNKQLAACDSAGKPAGFSGCIALAEKKQALEKEQALNQILRLTEINPDLVYESNVRARILAVAGYAFAGIVLGFIAGYLLSFLRTSN